MKKYVLFDHDDVLVDTEDREQYLRDMSQGLGAWIHPSRGHR